MKKVKIHAFAKINPYLDVCSRREDGYHNIESLMQTVTLCDRIDIELLDGEREISLTCSEPDLPCNEKNLVWRAADLFMTTLGTEGKRAVIHIEKNIPYQAGLGGGSADAAATLVAFNEIFDHPYDKTTLMNMGARLGADVPFCIEGGCARVGGIGEVVDPIESTLEYTAVVAIGGEGISTPSAFALLDGMNDEYRSYTPHGGIDRMVKACEDGSAKEFASELFNAFEAVILPTHSKAGEIREALVMNGADGALLSGSGPSVIGFFSDNDKAINAAMELKKLGVRAWVCRPICPKREF